MKVGFYVESYEHLGVEYLSAVLKEAGHETEMFFDPRLFNDSSFSIPVFAKWLNVEDLLLDEICNADLDLLCFSVVTDNYSSALRMAARVKKEINITTMFGGIHATSVPERVIKRPEVDYVIIGEGEGAIVDLVTALANGDRDISFPNLHYINGRGEAVANDARPTITDLDELPFPDKDAFYSKVPAFHQKRYSTAASRGCVYACTFCNNNFYKKMYKGKGRWQRRRSVDNLIAELEWAQERYDIERIQFFDEIFVDHHDWLEEFADKYPKAIGKPFFAWAYPKYCKPEMIELLEKAGCCEVNIGVQTINEYTKRKRLKRGEKTEKVAEAAALFKNSSILLSTGNILEIPGQPIEEGLELAEFYANNRVDMTYVGFMRYYPRTEIIDIGIEEGVLTAEDVEMIEEAAEERPFLKPMGDDSHDWLCVRCLVQMTCFMPRWFILFLIRSGWWRRLPTIDVYHVVFTISYHFRRMWTGKTRFVENYTAPQYAFSILHYAWKKFRAKSSKSGPTKGEPLRVHDESATDTP